MVKKRVTVTLPEHVYSLVKKKAEATHGDDAVAAFIRDLVVNQFTEEELQNELKPMATGKNVKAKYSGTCPVCKKQIIEDVDYVSPIGTIFEGEANTWVHYNCCRK